MIIKIIFIIFSSLPIFCVSSSENWIKAGYWFAGYWNAGSFSPIPDINSALFTHLFCGFATVNSSNYHLSIPESDEQYYSNFTRIVKLKNPSIVTLLSISDEKSETVKAIVGEHRNLSVLSSMLNTSSNRKSFIEDSIKTARRYGFQGLDLCWLWPSSDSDMNNMGIFLDEWREAVNSESRNTNLPRLLLSMALHYVPEFGSVTYPIESLVRNLDWGNLMAYDYHLPAKDNLTASHSALYDPNSHINTDYGISQWLSRGFPSEKLVMGLPFHGYKWTLVDPTHNEIGAKASEKPVTLDDSMSYKLIKEYTRNYGAEIIYNDTYVVNYCVIGSTWIGFDDVEAIRAKVDYAMAKKLLGYNIFLVINDDNWVLSRAAYGEENHKDSNKREILLIIILLPVSLIILLVAFLKIISCKFSRSNETENSDATNLQVYSFEQIKNATNNFSSENMLGEGGFGIVYKGKLSREREIAVKRLSTTSNQGIAEFKNEVTLTARLQHVNLCRVVGYCNERDENMLIYEYMPKSSLDYYIFDPIRKYELDWERRVNIIEGITQGLLNLQEYSNFTIIHRDLKASNILLDKDMNPKISDFGIAKLFQKDEIEAKTERIVGTYGYVPPEYVRKGTYSMKYDVYSFGVLLLQIISGKRSTCLFGPSESLHLLEYAYQTWSNEKGVEFFDSSLDDSFSSCKLVKCLQIALLCVQENPNHRPSMLEVFAMLRDETNISISTPNRPAFSKKIDRQDENSQPTGCSANLLTLSDVIPR